MGFEPQTEINKKESMIKQLQQIDANNFANCMNKLIEMLQSKLIYTQALQE